MKQRSDNNNIADSKFGLRGVFEGYTFCDFFKESLWPIILSVLITTGLTITDVSPILILNEIVNLAIDILPNLIGLFVAGYTIIISFYWSPIAIKINDMPNGPNLLLGLNSTFIIAILLLIVSLTFSILESIIISYQIESEYSEVINSLAFFITVYILTFSIKSLKDVVVNLYNMGLSSIKVLNSSTKNSK